MPICAEPQFSTPLYRRRDCTDVEDLTAAEMEGREQAMHALSALKGVVPGFEGARLRNFGMTIGTRDSRKIVGRSVGITALIG